MKDNKFVAFRQFSSLPLCFVRPQFREIFEHDFNNFIHKHLSSHITNWFYLSLFGKSHGFQGKMYNVEYVLFRSIIILITIIIFIIVIMAIITFIIAARPFEISLCMLSIDLHVRVSLAVWGNTVQHTGSKFLSRLELLQIVYSRYPLYTSHSSFILIRLLWPICKKRNNSFKN